MDPKQRLPSFPLPTLQRRQDLLLQLLIRLEPVELLPRQLREITEGVLALMPQAWTRNTAGKRVPDEQLLERRRRAIRSVLHPFREQRIHSDAQRYLLVRYLVGNWDTLVAGEEWQPWRNYEKETWTAIWFLDVERRVDTRDRLYRCEFASCTGAAAGQTWQQLFSGGFLQILMREAGAPRYKQWQDMDIGGVWFNCWLRMESGRLRFRDVKPSSTQLAHNKELFTRRQQLCSGPFCRNGRAPCINCPVGRVACPLARHEETYDQQARCLNYELKEGSRVWHRGYLTTHSEGVCLSCLNHGVFRRDVIDAIIEQRRSRKVSSNGAAQVEPSTTPSDPTLEGGFAPRFRPWSGDVWKKGHGSVPAAHEGHREVCGDVHPASPGQPAGAVQGVPRETGGT
jgi:hypothetical protein